MYSGNVSPLDKSLPTPAKARLSMNGNVSHFLFFQCFIQENCCNSADIPEIFSNFAVGLNDAF